MTDETPSADETTSAEPTPEPAAAAPEPATEATTPEPAAEAVAPEQATAAAPAQPPTAAAAAAPPPERRGGIFLPTWLAALLAVLLVGGLGFVIGYASGDDDDSNPSIAANSQPNVPNGGNLPNGGNRPNLPNGGNLPGYPGNGNGSGNSNGETNASAAFLGVSVENADNGSGASITAVRSGSPASEAGLKEGDVITKVGDTDVKSAADLIGAIRSHDPGDDVTVTYTRDGSSAQVTVHLGDRSDIARSSLPS